MVSGHCQVSRWQKRTSVLRLMTRKALLIDCQPDSPVLSSLKAKDSLWRSYARHIPADRSRPGQASNSLGCRCPAQPSPAPRGGQNAYDDIFKRIHGMHNCALGLQTPAEQNYKATLAKYTYVLGRFDLPPRHLFANEQQSSLGIDHGLQLIALLACSVICGEYGL